MESGRKQKASCSCSTELRRTPFVLTWKVHNVRKMLEAEQFDLSSTEFKPDKSSVWKMSFVVDTENRSGVQTRLLNVNLKRSLELYAASSQSGKVSAFLKAWIESGYSRDGNEVRTRHYVYRPRQLFEFSKGDSHCLRLNVPEKRVTKRYSDVLFGKHLVIKCKLTICEKLRSVYHEPNNYNSGEATLNRDMAQLLESGQLADVEFNVGGTKLQAHRCVLSARSSYYRAMFDKRSCFNESRDIGTIGLDCSDIQDPNSMRTFLRYIYTDKLVFEEVGQEESTSFLQYVGEVLHLADKTNLCALLELVERRLIDRISASNAIDLLAFGDCFNAKNLKTAAIRFIKQHAELVTGSDIWETLIRERPHLCTEMLFAT